MTLQNRNTRAYQIWRKAVKSNLYFSLFALSLFTLVACTESFEERCRREAREYTERQCPRLIDQYIVMDSMTYEDEPQGFTYHQTVQGELDNDSLLTPEAISTFQEELLDNWTIYNWTITIGRLWQTILTKFIQI